MTVVSLVGIICHASKQKTVQGWFEQYDKMFEALICSLNCDPTSKSDLPGNLQEHKVLANILVSDTKSIP